MSFDKFASADGKQPQGPSNPPAPEESGEELFAFDELPSVSPGVAADMKRELDEALSQVEQARRELARSVPPQAAPAPTPVAPGTLVPPARPAPPPLRAPAPQAAPVPATAPVATTVVQQRLSVSPLAAALLAAVVLANVALMAFAWRSVNATKQMVLDVASDVRDASADMRDESTRRSELASLASEPVFGALPEGYRTLEIARERIARGEHARARRMLFSLLAVIDRIEPPARSEVEARAGFLIADSYRLEGDALSVPPEVRR